MTPSCCQRYASQKCRAKPRESGREDESDQSIEEEAAVPSIEDAKQIECPGELCQAYPNNVEQ